ncbi:neuropilin and tolloid-like protein 2 [Penaeus monodon]|uniref:neuropilin and tolloid-like protein 2 n=1 Tax=Penaeus monodon TaxID=6687 RepID=UPI0018A78B78|nr:neuropilin and tolloid-like protein 2 [Penaeus monodon]
MLNPSQMTQEQRCQSFSNANLEKKEFYSPLYPNNYPNNTECILRLEAEHGYVIRVDFRDYFHLEPSNKCEFDVLGVRDGAHGYSDLMGRFCGGTFPPIITSKDRYLWLKFISDDTIEYSGFRAVFSYIENKSHQSGWISRPRSLTAPNLPLQALDRPYIEPCRYYLHGEQGKISSDDVEEERLEYSRQHNHPIDCTWVVTVKARRRCLLPHFRRKKFVKYEPSDFNNFHIGPEV